MDLILMFAAICNIVKFVVETAKQNEKVARAIDGKTIVKVILVKNKLVNLIVK